MIRNKTHKHTFFYRYVLHLSKGLMNCFFFHKSGFTGLMKPSCVTGLVVCINQNPPESATNTLCASSLVLVTESRDLM